MALLPSTARPLLFAGVVRRGAWIERISGAAMPYGLYISAQGAFAQSQRLEALANNLANVDTTGFKRDLAVFQARYANETEHGLDYPGSRSTTTWEAG